MGCSLFTLEEGEPSKTSWTLMIYASGDNNLDNDLLDDFQEMEAAITSDYLNVILLIDLSTANTAGIGFSDTRAYRIQHDEDDNSIGSEELEIGPLALYTSSQEELDLANPDTLSSFVSWCKGNYPADHYALIMEGHGDGWYNESSYNSGISAMGVGHDEDDGQGSSTYHYLSPGDIETALTGNEVDIIGFDACLMGTGETLYQLRDIADFAWANPYPVPGYGNNYRILLEHLDQRRSSVASFGWGYLSAYDEAYGNTIFNGSYRMDTCNVALYDLSKMSQFIESSVFAKWNILLMDKMARISEEQANGLAIVDDTSQYIIKDPDNSQFHYRDLLELYRWADNTSLDLPDFGGFIKTYKSYYASSSDSEADYHLGIYFPTTKITEGDLSDDLSAYRSSLDFADTNWDELIEAYLLP